MANVYDVATAQTSPYAAELAAKAGTGQSGLEMQEWKSGKMKEYRDAVERRQKVAEEKAKKSAKKWGNISKLVDIGSFFLPPGMGALTKGLIKGAAKGIAGHQQAKETQKGLKGLGPMGGRFKGTFLEGHAGAADKALAETAASLDPSQAGLASAAGSLMGSGFGAALGAIGDKMGISKVLNAETKEDFIKEVGEEGHNEIVNLSDTIDKAIADKGGQLPGIDTTTGESVAGNVNIDYDKCKIFVGEQELDVGLVNKDDLLKVSKYKSFSESATGPESEGAFWTNELGTQFKEGKIQSVGDARESGWKEAFQLKGEGPYDAGFKSLFGEGKLTGRMEEFVTPWRGQDFSDLWKSAREGDFSGLGMYGEIGKWAVPGMQTTDIAVAPPEQIALGLSPYGNPNWMQGLQ